MSASQQIILVLWGQGFDEIAASIFVAELRRLGQKVRLVGLNSQHIAGQYGVTLLPDLPLGQALRTANRIRCIIVPAPLASLQQFSYDPRLAELLSFATNNQALTVVAPSSPEANHPSLQPQSNNLSNFNLLHQLAYPPNEELLSFIQSVLVPRL